MSASLSMPANISDFSTLVVPTNTGLPVFTIRLISVTTAFHFPAFDDDSDCYTEQAEVRTAGNLLVDLLVFGLCLCTWSRSTKHAQLYRQQKQVGGGGHDQYRGKDGK